MSAHQTDPAQDDRAERIPDEELVAEDDTIIGKAFLWSLLVFVVIGAGIGVTIWQIGKQGPTAPPVKIQQVAVQETRRIADPPQVAFDDITDMSGIDFVHENGATGDKLLPESMGAGVAFFDYDNDGDQDVLLVNGASWPHNKPKGEPATCKLYQNNGKGRFTDVSVAVGLDVTLYGMGVACGDHDNDGDVDVYLTAVGPNRMFRNDGGKFTEITREAGVAGGENAWSTSAGYLDYDKDGDLDLFVCNYIKWSRDIDFAVDFKLVGVGRAYGPPTNFEGAHCSLYRNDGNGKFTDVSEAAGIHVKNPATDVPMGKALALGFADFNRDGHIDVFVANDTVQNFLFYNNGDGTFTESGAVSGVAYDSMGNATGAMGTDVADFRNENTLGVCIGNFANEMTSLYLARNDPAQFTDVAIVEGIGAPSRQRLSFGLFFFDYDLDGRLDLLQANGHLEDEINKVQASQHYEQPAQLFWNAGPRARACFTEVPSDDLGDLARPIVGRGATYADIDDDGDLDVLLTQVAGPPLLLRNDQTLGHHWLRVKLVGRNVNRDAIGAWIEVDCNGTTQRRQVMPTRSYLSQVELPVTFGLGTSQSVDRLRIRWPDGSTQEHQNVAANQRLVIEQRDDDDATLARVK